ncbi:unnamed protein product [Ectocarpus sp. 12 AP-2014]
MDVFSVLNLQDAEGAREEAEGLVSKYLLRDVGGGGYRVYDLVLDFVKVKIKAHVEMVGKVAVLQAPYVLDFVKVKIKAEVEMLGKVTVLQAHFLRRLDVLEAYEHPEHGAGNQSLFVLDAFWRSVEKLSGDPRL